MAYNFMMQSVPKLTNDVPQGRPAASGLSVVADQGIKTEQKNSITPPSHTASQRVGPGSYLTLRYRVTLADGRDAVSTFGGGPATLALGSGQLAEPLERCLIGMRAGERAAYTLEPEAAFGLRNPELVQRIAKQALPRVIDDGIGSQIAFTDTSGARFAGTLLSQDETHAVFDFNHPLAGQTIVFEAEIIGIL